MLKVVAHLLFLLEFQDVCNLAIFEFAVLQQFQLCNFVLEFLQLLSLFRLQIKIASDISLLLLFEFIALVLQLLQVQHSDVVQLSLVHFCIARVL